ncbi:hypothetical protein NPIL_569951 [Nephila pilipes]|uniref:Uncharacterized protein n=1 Tax=Nephila pilipes TaxID=299642 RepID=A0A8X6UAT5_NEPPI|nr:hypothetical protein NPIL_569951 [Nephila pilipes]
MAPTPPIPSKLSTLSLPHTPNDTEGRAKRSPATPSRLVLAKRKQNPGPLTPNAKLRGDGYDHVIGQLSAAPCRRRDLRKNKLLPPNSHPLNKNVIAENGFRIIKHIKKLTNPLSNGSFEKDAMTLEVRQKRQDSSSRWQQRKRANDNTEYDVMKCLQMKRRN